MTSKTAKLFLSAGAPRPGRQPNRNNAAAIARRRAKQLADGRELVSLALAAGSPKKVIIISVARQCRLTITEARAIYKEVHNNARRHHD